MPPDGDSAGGLSVAEEFAAYEARYNSQASRIRCVWPGVNCV